MTAGPPAAPAVAGRGDRHELWKDPWIELYHLENRGGCLGCARACLATIHCRYINNGRCRVSITECVCAMAGAWRELAAICGDDPLAENRPGLG